jgi:hypothetical protein
VRAGEDLRCGGLWRRKHGTPDAQQRREIAHLQHEALMLKAELERTTGKPLELTPEDRQRLAEKAAGIDLETLRQICVFDPAELVAPDQEPDSTENR